MPNSRKKAPELLSLRRQLALFALLALLLFGQLSIATHDHGPIYQHSVECNICVLHAGLHAAAGQFEFVLPSARAYQPPYLAGSYLLRPAFFAGNRDPPAQS